MQERAKQLEALERDLDAVPDGTGPPEHAKRRDTLLAAADGPVTLHVDVDKMTLAPLDMEHDAKSLAFRQDFLKRKEKQDAGLDKISEGVSKLKEIGHAMQEEMNKHDPMIEVLGFKADDGTAKLRVLNGEIKARLTEMRQPHKVCLDLILLAILLGIGSYIFTLTKS